MQLQVTIWQRCTCTPTKNQLPCRRLAYKITLAGGTTLALSVVTSPSPCAKKPPIELVRARHGHRERRPRGRCRRPPLRLRRHRGGRGHHGQLHGARGGVPRRAGPAPGALRPAAPPGLLARRVPHHPRRLPEGAVPADGPPRAPPLGGGRGRVGLQRADPGAAALHGATHQRLAARRHQERRRGGGGPDAEVGRRVPGPRRVGDRGERARRRRPERDQGGGHVPGARRQEGRRGQGQDGGRRRQEGTRGGWGRRRGGDERRRRVPRRQVRGDGRRVGEQAGQVHRRPGTPHPAAAHDGPVLAHQGRPRAGPRGGVRFPDVLQLRRPARVRHAVAGAAGPDQDQLRRWPAVRPRQPRLGARWRWRGGAGCPVDRRVPARPRGHRRRAGLQGVVHVLHDARQRLRYRLPRRRVRERRRGRGWVLRARVQDGAGGGEDPG